MQGQNDVFVSDHKVLMPFGDLASVRPEYGRVEGVFKVDRTLVVTLDALLVIGLAVDSSVEPA